MANSFSWTLSSDISSPNLEQENDDFIIRQSNPIDFLGKYYVSVLYRSFIYTDFLWLKPWKKEDFEADIESDLRQLSQNSSLRQLGIELSRRIIVAELSRTYRDLQTIFLWCCEALKKILIVYILSKEPSKIWQLNFKDYSRKPLKIFC